MWALDSYWRFAARDGAWLMQLYVKPGWTSRGIGANLLREMLADAAEGIDGSKPVIAYCRIGERSSHSWFVLKYLLGFDKVANYDGSWTEWGNLVGVPVERGVPAAAGA